MANNTEIKAFIQKFGRLAVAECNRRIANGEGFILPSVCMAQSALETNWGTSGLMTRAHAFFGVKAGGSWTGAIYVADTWEVSPNGEKYNTVANFRAYNTDLESLQDYYKTTTTLSRYKNAVSYGADKSKWLSARETITAIWQGGYATDDLYVQKIMNTINGRTLTDWDDMITGEGEIVLPDSDKDFTVSDLVQGNLIITDGGRTFSNDKTATNAVALDWEKAFTVQTGTTFTVTGFDGFKMYVARLSGDTPSFTGPYYPGDQIGVIAGTTIGFYLMEKYDRAISIDDLPKGFGVSFDSPLPNGSEKYSETLAFFVEIQ